MYPDTRDPVIDDNNILNFLSTGKFDIRSNKNKK